MQTMSKAALIGAIVGLLVLASFARQSVDLTVSLLADPARGVVAEQSAAFRCLEQRIEEQVPRSAKVYFDADDLWRQRATESTYPRFRVQTSPRAADYVVRITGSAQGCDGVDVDVVSR